MSNFKVYLNAYKELMNIEKNKGIAAKINPKAKRTKSKRKGRK